MNKLLLASGFALLSSLSLAGSARADAWEIDSAHSGAHFSVRHMMVSTVRGDLGKVSGTVSLDDKDVTKSTVDATVDVTAINTREPKRDAHLKSPDFFDAAKFPTITFKSKKVEAATPGHLKVTGDLTMRGVTKSVTLDVEGPSAAVTAMGGTKRGATITGKLNRKDFGLVYNKVLETGGVAVGEDVNVEIDLELNKKK
jgi:polyisoprenoid-binding protein YceI